MSFAELTFAVSIFGATDLAAAFAGFIAFNGFLAGDFNAIFFAGAFAAAFGAAFFAAFFAGFVAAFTAVFLAAFLGAIFDFEFFFPTDFGLT